jgi:hypothetical protein
MDPGLHKNTLKVKMPPPTPKPEARERLSEILRRDNATLVSPIEGVITSRTPVTYVCRVVAHPPLLACGVQHTKTFSNLIHGPGGAICTICAGLRGVTKRKYTLTDCKMNINNGETDFNRDLAEKTAAKDGSTLLGIYSLEDDGSYVIIKNDARINRDSWLHIRCAPPCNKKEYINFRLAYGQGALGPGNGLCLCAGCRKGHKSDALRRHHRGEPPPEVIESISARSARIEADGQECTDCKEHKPAKDFGGSFNRTENCKVHKGRCYTCSRKLRTANREDATRNGTLENFLNGELVAAKDRTKKHNAKHPTDVREFDITVPFLVDLFERQDGKCALSGLPMSTTTHIDERPDDARSNPNKLSIDRIDSSRGYTEDNVQLVRWRPNDMKKDMLLDPYKEEIRIQYEFLFGIPDIPESATLPTID